VPNADLTNLGLFPLGLVLLPGEHLPLHIFESRYRALIADCTLGARPFVLSFATDDGVAKTGCTAHPQTLVRRFADGRMNLVVEGGERVEIVEQTTGELYITARVRPIMDIDEPVSAALADEVGERFGRLAEAVAGAAHTPDVRDGVPLSYAIAGAFELDPVPKQRLLESRSETERLTLVRSLLDTALARLDRQEVAAERAQTNGKVTLP
jgi:ATP-dependent Lon protease